MLGTIISNLTKQRQILHLKAAKLCVVYELRISDLEEIAYRNINLKKAITTTRKSLCRYDNIKKEWTECCPKIDYICNMPEGTD